MQTSRTNKRKSSDVLTTGLSRASNQINNGLNKHNELKLSRSLSIGNVLDVSITALGPKKQGITELSNGITIITSDFPNANLDDKIRIQIVKINLTKPVFAMAKLQEILKKSQKEVPVQVGEILEFSVNSFSKGPQGSSIIELPTKISGGYRILIPSFPSNNQYSYREGLLSLTPKVLGKQLTPKDLLTQEKEKKEQYLSSSTAQKMKIEITRVKSNYAIAKICFPILKSSGKIEKNMPLGLKSKPTSFGKTKVQYRFGVTKVSRTLAGVTNIPSFPKSSLLYLRNKEMSPKLTVGTQLQVFLPFYSNKLSSKILVNSSKSGEYLVTKLNGLPLFLKLSLGVTFNKKTQNNKSTPTKVQIQMIKIENDFMVAKVIQVSPISRVKKQLKVKYTVQTMLKSGMHFGEKAIKSHANMKKYIWLRKKGSHLNSLNRPLIKKGRYLINLLKTRRCLIHSLKQLAKYAAKGRTFLFVGTKKPAAGLVARAALLTKNAFFVNTRWLGGMLTNWKTILKSISKIKPILREKQKMIQTILEKRQEVKKSLIQKVNKLRKKSRLLIQKGQFLITQVKNEKSKLLETSQILLRKKSEFLQKNQLLLQKYQQLNDNAKKLQEKTIQFEQKGNVILLQKKVLISQLVSYQKKLKELNLLLLLGQELKLFKRDIFSQGKELLSISYEQFSKFTENPLLLKSVDLVSSFDNTKGVKEATQGEKSQVLLAQGMESQVLVPNPPKVLLNKMIRLIRQRSNTGLMKNLSVNLSKQTEKQSEATLIQNREGFLISKLLTKFSRFIPFIKAYKEILILRIQNTQTLLVSLQKTLQKFHAKINGEFNSVSFVQLKKQVLGELSLVKNQLFSSKEIIKLMQVKLKKLASEQRLLDFLPRLRYLPTPKSKMAEAIQILMKKFVDPKMRYPLDKIYDEKLKFHSKKIAATRKKKWQRLEKYFGGITKMAKMKRPQISQNVAIIVGQREEMNAVYECKKLGIKMFHIVDTNCNPRLADYLVPANDDSRNSIKLILGQILTYLKLAQKLRKKIVKTTS